MSTHKRAANLVQKPKKARMYAMPSLEEGQARLCAYKLKQAENRTSVFDRPADDRVTRGALAG